MGLLEDFHHDFLPRFIDAQIAFHDGDAAPNNALWTDTDPVTLFAARGLCKSGTDRDGDPSPDAKCGAGGARPCLS